MVLRFLARIAVLAALGPPLAAQADKGYQDICHFLPVAADSDSFAELDPSSSIVDAVEMIVQAATGNSADASAILVRASTVPNAAATLREGERLVLYNDTFFDQLAAANGGSWIGSWELRSVLAHELGHHILGHTLGVDRETRFQKEADADAFSGRIVCNLGGTLADAKAALGATGGSPNPLYPTLTERLAAVSAGWRRALEDDDCPDVVRPPLPAEKLTDARDGVSLTPETASTRLEGNVLEAGWVQVDEGIVRSDQPIRIVADVVSFSPGSGLSAPEIVIAASEIRGGLLDASGAPGVAGGRIVVGAVTVRGTEFRARGGPGTPGPKGDDGTAGTDGTAGRDGRCGPGALGQFVGSSNGGDGTNGGPGDDGGRGGDGGPGGEIYLMRFDTSAVSFDIDGGHGGPGGQGGTGGPGGRGGRGGSGCQGLGGHQPTRDGGRSGHPGTDGRDALPGSNGEAGRVYEGRISGLPELREMLEHAPLADQMTERFIKRAREGS